MIIGYVIKFAIDVDPQDPRITETFPPHTHNKDDKKKLDGYASQVVADLVTIHKVSQIEFISMEGSPK